MIAAAGEERRADIGGQRRAVQLFAATWAEALPLLRYSPRVTGIGRRVYDLRGCSAVLSVGFAGACRVGLRPGDVIVCGEVPPSLDAVTGELRTLNHIASAAEKAALGAQGVAGVDMETSWLAAAAAEAGLPFLGVRAIIDRLQDRPVGLATAAHYLAACRGLRRAVREALRVWPPR